MTYRAPLTDIAHALKVAGLEDLVATGAFDNADRETVTAILEAAGQLSEGVLAPLNRSGDQEGVRLENGKVHSAAGFADAWKQYAQGGWTGVAADPQFGGQGLPKVLSLAAFEMAHAANMSFALCPLLGERWCAARPNRMATPTASPGRRSSSPGAITT